MAALTTEQILAVWKDATSRDRDAIYADLPGKADRDADVQIIEDVIAPLALDLSTFRKTIVPVTTADQDTVKAALDGGTFAVVNPALAALARLVIEGAHDTREQRDDDAITTWADANVGLFTAMTRTDAYKKALIRAYLRQRV